MKRIALFATLLLALPLAADHLENCTISQSSGPTSGGNSVTVRCNLGDWPSAVIFGNVPAVSTERTDEHTLVTVAPPHLPGTVDIRLFEYDIFRGTDLTYTFEGDPPEQLERFLLPIYLPPIPGAFGSEFVTDFRARKKGMFSVSLHGIWPISNDVLELGHSPLGYQPRDFEYTGTPGRFFYVKDENATDFAATLHVYDTSRTGENRGTQIPVVRYTEFDTILFLLGVPTDPLYRNTLRIYGTAPGTVNVTIGEGTPFPLQLQGGSDSFEPAYAQFTNFPAGTETVDVKIESAVPVWAFISTTNNDTQLITTITP